MILAGDIGGTKVNLGLFEVNERQLTLRFEDSRPSKNYQSLQDLVQEFLTEQGHPKIERACFGVAGPVKHGKARVTNLPWEVAAAELAGQIKIESVALINDLEANCYGLAELKPSDILTLNEGEANALGNAALISAGTGLGEAGLFWDGQFHRPFACEGGHSDFAPQTKLDEELFDYLHAQSGHVSWEKVLSGMGLNNIYQFLKETKRGEEPASMAQEMAAGDPGAIITQAALAGTSSRCQQALELFVRYYGTEAGNLGLKLMSTGGMYIGGGIAPRILPRLQCGFFMRSFCDKGRMSSLMSAMPVRVILNPKTALLGAGHFGAFGATRIVSPTE